MPNGRAVLAPSLALLCLALGAASFCALSQSSDPEDKYLWLEDVNSPRAMDWVKAEDARTAKILEADPLFASYDEIALKVNEDPSRLPMPGLQGDEVYNFWNDEKNVRGLLRKTTLTDYSSPTPQWKTVLDIDALDKQENTSWVFHGSNCLYPGDEYCMFDLSVGGEDASTSREFDLKENKFVEGGFLAPHSKQDIAWQDKNTLLIARDWGAGSMTESGYPFIVKEWKRGTPLDSAKEVFRGEPSDISAGSTVLHDAQGDRLTIFQRAITAFESRWWIQTPSGLKELAIPRKASPAGLLSGRLLIDTHEDWTPNPAGPKFTQGSLLAVRLADIVADPAHPKPAVVFAPTADEFLNGAATTHSRLLIATLKHVLGRAYVYTPTGKDGWAIKTLDVPDNSTINIVTASDANETFFLST
jgi:prolyl oligopeptidase